MGGIEQILELASPTYYVSWREVPTAAFNPTESLDVRDVLLIYLSVPNISVKQDVRIY